MNFLIEFVESFFMKKHHISKGKGRSLQGLILFRMGRIARRNLLQNL